LLAAADCGLPRSGRVHSELAQARLACRDALCLAGEAAARDEPELGEVFRNVAAGITLLGRRANGTSTTTETIFLVAMTVSLGAVTTILASE